MRAVRKVVQSGRYRSASELFREAIDEKLERLRRERLAAQVERFCDGVADEDEVDLVGAQAFDPED